MMNFRETAGAAGQVAFNAGKQLHWLILAAALLFIAYDFGLQDTHPGLQAEISAIGKLSLRGYLGYWFAVWFLGHFDKNAADPMEKVARAIIVAGFVLAPRG